MLCYPQSYDLLSEEELEYTSGGSEGDFMFALAAGSLATLLLSTAGYLLNAEQIRNRKKAEEPEKYLPESDPEKRKQLAEDTKEELLTTPLGMASVAGFVASGVCIVTGCGITIANMFGNASKK